MERRLSEPRPEFLVLGFLAGGASHGYQLYQLFERRLGQVWHISQSQWYAMLKRLLTKGWIQALPAESPGRQEYALTPEGTQRFQQWLRADSVSSARIIRLEFISRLFFAELLEPSLVSALLAGQIRLVRDELQRHEGLLNKAVGGEGCNILALAAWLESLPERWPAVGKGFSTV